MQQRFLPGGGAFLCCFVVLGFLAVSRALLGQRAAFYPVLLLCPRPRQEPLRPSTHPHWRALLPSASGTCTATTTAPHPRRPAAPSLLPICSGRTSSSPPHRFFRWPGGEGEQAVTHSASLKWKCDKWNRTRLNFVRKFQIYDVQIGSSIPAPHLSALLIPNCRFRLSRPLYLLPQPKTSGVGMRLGPLLWHVFNLVPSLGRSHCIHICPFLSRGSMSTMDNTARLQRHCAQDCLCSSISNS